VEARGLRQRTRVAHIHTGSPRGRDAPEQPGKDGL